MNDVYKLAFYFEKFNLQVDVCPHIEFGYCFVLFWNYIFQIITSI